MLSLTREKIIVINQLYLYHRIHSERSLQFWRKFQQSIYHGCLHSPLLPANITQNLLQLKRDLMVSVVSTRALWCLTRLSTIFHLYRVGQFYLRGNQSTQRKPEYPEYPEKTRVPRENHRHTVSYWQTSSHKFVSNTHRHEGSRNDDAILFITYNKLRDRPFNF